MSHRTFPRAPVLRLRSASVAVVAVVLAVVVGGIGCQSLAASSAATAPLETRAARAPAPHVGAGQTAPTLPTAREGQEHRAKRSDHDGALGVAGGVVPAGTTVFDDDVPAVENLDPKLLAALRRAATDAAADHVRFSVNSGWRSAAYQERLFDQAVARYGSSEAAARWVAPPGTSAHQTGDAVDIGHADAARWLAEHGDDYGLCRIYGNEPWHFELRPEAVDHGCPAPYADATDDPRLAH